MIKNRDIICLSFSDWEKELVSNRFHILTRFAKKNRVFLFERQIYPLWRDKHRFFKFFSIRKKDGIYLITPAFFLPLSILNNAVYFFYLKIVIAKFKIKKPIFWFYNYRLGFIIDYFKSSLACYHCTEDYAQSSRISKIKSKIKKIKEAELKLARRVDLIFAVSDYLARRLGKINRNTFLTINAVDYNLYKKAQSKVWRRSFGQRPVIGYSGNISDKVDFNLLNRIAATGKYTLLMVGPIVSENHLLKGLAKTKNVIFLGKQPLERLPTIINQFDVCLIPFITDEWLVKASQPLKLFEYLATGKPIVSTRMDCLKKMEDVVYIGENHEKILTLLEKAVAEKSMNIRKKRINLAKTNTWDKKFQIMNRAMSNSLKHEQMAND